MQRPLMSEIAIQASIKNENMMKTSMTSNVVTSIKASINLLLADLLAVLMVG